MGNDETEWLRQQGYRLTPQRMQVLQVIKMRGEHVTAEEIHAAILPQQPYLALTTVYRTLQWLQRVGLVAPITIAGRLCYEYHAPGHCHHHLICQQCGQHVEIADELFATLRNDLQQRYGFQLKVAHLALSGLCATCAAAGVSTADS